eukprot:1175488-Prorocentrum_minimum.AAC.2
MFASPLNVHTDTHTYFSKYDQDKVFGAKGYAYDVKWEGRYEFNPEYVPIELEKALLWAVHSSAKDSKKNSSIFWHRTIGQGKQSEYNEGSQTLWEVEVIVVANKTGWEEYEHETFRTEMERESATFTEQKQTKTPIGTYPLICGYGLQTFLRESECNSIICHGMDQRGYKRKLVS